MAGELEESYRTLESRVAEKTPSLAQQNARLSTLYDMTAFLNAPELAGGAVPRVPAAADGRHRRGRRRGAPGGARSRRRDAAPVRRGAAARVVRREGALPARAASARAARPRRAAAAIVHVLGGKRMPISVHAAALPRGGLRDGRAPSRSPRSTRCWASTTCSSATRASSPREERHMLESLGQHLGVAIESLRLVSQRARARDRRGAQPARAGAARLDRAVARVPQPAGADAAQGARGARRRRGTCASPTRSRPACRNPTPTCASCWSTSAPARGEGDVEHGVRTLLTRFERQTGVQVRAAGDAAQRCRSRPTCSCR